MKMTINLSGDGTSQYSGGHADAAIQRDVDRLEKWAERNHMKFSMAKCRALLHVGKTPWQYRLGSDRLRSSSGKEILRALGDIELSMSQQCALTAKTASSINGSTVSRSREVIIHTFAQG